MPRRDQSSRGFRRLIIYAVTLVFLSATSFLFFKFASYYRALEGFSLSIRSYDRIDSEKRFKDLKDSYNSFSAIGLRYFADKYLFKDMYKYEAAVAHVNEDFEKSINILTGHEDDSGALNMRGVAKFRILHAAYHSQAARSNPKLKEEILRKVLEEVRPDFESAVKKGPGPAEDFDSVFNYDLTSNPNSAKMALESVRPMPRFILGMQAEGRRPGLRGRMRPREKRLEDATPGNGDVRKKG